MHPPTHTKVNNVEYEKRRDEGEPGTCRCFGDGIKKKEKKGKWRTNGQKRQDTVSQWFIFFKPDHVFAVMVRELSL
jgi:hypothetical protein